MKKQLLFFFLILSFSQVKSQVLFNETFNGIPGDVSGGPGTFVFPTGWTLIDVDNSTPFNTVNYVNNAWARRDDFSFNTADSAAFSTSYYTTPDTADDWMWTPAIATLPANCFLSWSGVTYDAAYPDGYEVRVMAAPNVPTGGAGAIGNQISNSTQIFSVVAENASWTSHSVSLNAFAGQTVYIGFRNNSYDKFLLLIDNVKVEVQVAYDNKLLSVDPISEYTQLPTTQVQPYGFGGKIINAGLNALTNVNLNVEIKDATNAVVYTSASSPIGIAPGDTGTFNIPACSISTQGSYSVKYYVSSTETDQVSSNDTLYDMYAISDTIYARDNGNVVGSLGIGAGNGGFLGQDFEVVNSDDLTTVTMYYTRGYTGRKCAAAIWSFTAGVPGTMIASTDTILYPDDSARTYTIPIHGGPLTLTPGRYAITAIEFDSTIALGLTSGKFTPGRTWVTWPTSPAAGWANNEYFGNSFAKSYALRANFGVVCNLSAGVISSDATCFGASNGSLSLTVNGGTLPINYTWTPNAGSGSAASNLSAGSYDILMTDANACTLSVTVQISEPAAINVTTSTSGPTITATSATGTYQWLDCNAGSSPIANETNQSFTATANGDYAVAITVNGCTSTSSCVNVTGIGIPQLNANDGLTIYPNPNSGIFSVKTPVAGMYSIYNHLGQAVKTIELTSKNNFTVTVDDLSNGVYTISGVKSGKSVKQNIVINK